MSQSPSLACCKAAIWHSRSNSDSQMNPPHSCSGAAECPADPALWGTAPWPPATLRLHQPCWGCSPQAVLDTCQGPASPALCTPGRLIPAGIQDQQHSGAASARRCPWVTGNLGPFARSPIPLRTRLHSRAMLGLAWPPRHSPSSDRQGSAEHL